MRLAAELEGAANFAGVACDSASGHRGLVTGDCEALRIILIGFVSESDDEVAGLGIAEEVADAVLLTGIDAEGLKGFERLSLVSLACVGDPSVAGEDNAG